MKQARLHVNHCCCKGCLNKTLGHKVFLNGIGWQREKGVSNDWHHRCVGFPLCVYHAPNIFTAIMEGKSSFTSMILFCDSAS